MGAARTIAAVVALALAAGGAAAHEFWIEAEDYVLPRGETVAAHLRVGEELRGRSFPYLSHRFTRFELRQDGRTYQVGGQQGDLPAVRGTFNAAGLAILAYASTGDRVTYDDWETFESFLEYEGLGRAAQRHLDRGLPRTGFTEEYFRYAKALLQVGPVRPRDADEPFGLRLELVALANPYAGGAALPVRLLWEGEPLPGAQIALFRRDPGGETTRTTLRSGDGGEAEIPLGAGLHLLNAVHLLPAEGEDGVVWTSHWASMTFAPPPP